MKYVLASDGSKHSAKAAGWLVQHLPTDVRDEILVIYVFPLPPDADTLQHLVSLPTDSSDKRVCEVAQPILDFTRKALGHVEAPIREVVLVGNPAEEIITFATTQRADLIITGHRGRGAFQDMYLGSVSATVAHRAQCPVLVVR